MPTFEERYTAWLDGKLSGEELAAFELELEAQDLPAAQADREEVHQLGHLLRRHSGAPAFPREIAFTEQLQRSLRADLEPVQPAANELPASGSGGWRLSRLAWAAGICLLLSFGIFQVAKQNRREVTVADGTVTPTKKERVASASSNPKPKVTPSLAAVHTTSTLPSPVELPAMKANPSDPSIYASYVQSDQEGLTVVWLDGLDYLPDSYSLQ